MYDKVRESVRQRGIYGAARNLLLEKAQADTPILIEGRTTTQYILVPSLDDTSRAVLFDAALRLWEEGFYTAVFYMREHGDNPFLLVVWDTNISCEHCYQMPCFTCPSASTSVMEDRCFDCATLVLWSKKIHIPGSFVSHSREEQEDSTQQLVQQQPSDTVILSGIPSAARMQELSRIASGESVTYFEDTVAVRLARKLERWPTCQHIPIDLFPGVSTANYVTVALTPKECSERDNLRKVIVSLERKGYSCGPMISVHDRLVLFATWDERVMTYLPDRSPCISDCEATRSGLASCYCTEFDAWYAKWDNAVQDVRVLEQ